MWGLSRSRYTIRYFPLIRTEKAMSYLSADGGIKFPKNVILTNALKPEENLFKILDFTADDFDPFRLEHFDFSLDRTSRRMPFKPPNPTGCGNNPMSGNLRRIWISFHRLANPPVGLGSQGMGDFFIGCHPAGWYFP
jgi:hypothetical protein